MTDPLGDMLTRIRNAQMRGKPLVLAPVSKLRLRVLDVLEDAGYIRGHTVTSGTDGHPTVRIELKYHENRPVIREVARVSKPGRRVYAGVRRLPSFRNGLGMSVLSTPAGVMSDRDARTRNVGGEILCRIF